MLHIIVTELINERYSDPFIREIEGLGGCRIGEVCRVRRWRRPRGARERGVCSHRPSRATGQHGAPGGRALVGALENR
eukprot:158523-Prymnesium_polylepis.1